MLTERYRSQLGLAPTEPSAVGTLSEIPDRDAVAPEMPDPEKAAAADEGRDGIRTGSIRASKPGKAEADGSEIE